MDVTVQTVYDAPRELVAGIAGDPAQACRWYGNVRAVRWHGEPALVGGAKVDLVSRFLGRDLTYTYRVVDVVPGERLVMRAEQGPAPMETTFTWWDEEPAAGRAGRSGRPGRPRTGMAVRNAGRPMGMTTLGSGAATLGMRRAMRRDLERLRLVLREEQAGA